MLILAVDIGTGTQDILLFDSGREVENCLKMVMPSPTVQLAHAVRGATRRSQDVVLSGVLMGGGTLCLGRSRSSPGWLPGLCHTGRRAHFQR